MNDVDGNASASFDDGGDGGEKNPAQSQMVNEKSSLNFDGAIIMNMEHCLKLACCITLSLILTFNVCDVNTSRHKAHKVHSSSILLCLYLMDSWARGLEESELNTFDSIIVTRNFPGFMNFHSAAAKNC